MSTPFIGEIKMVSFNYPPKGWAFANGQSLPLNQNQALYALLGTTYGGNGTTTFNLPNLQGRSALHFGTNPNAGGSYNIGANGGEALHRLIPNEIPDHIHPVNVSTVTTQHSPNTSDLPGSGSIKYYDSSASPNNTFGGNAIANAGNGQPHENRMPYLTISFVVALQGIFPSRS